jgi:protein ImuB
MRRVVSLWLPNWPTDRIRRHGGCEAEKGAAANFRTGTLEQIAVERIVRTRESALHNKALEQIAVERIVRTRESALHNKALEQIAVERIVRTRESALHNKEPGHSHFSSYAGNALASRAGPSATLGDSAMSPSPLVTAAHDGRRRVLAAVDATAAALGLYAGMTVAQAQALVPGLVVHQAAPAADADALRRLAAWCLRYAPFTATDAPDGVWIEVTGGAHLHGGEAALLRGMIGRLLAQGFAARAAVAGTPGAAHAVARFGGQDIAIVGDTAPALAPLPIEGLRLPPEITNGLRLLGLERIGQLAAAPRAPLVRRFGALLTTRLDQALGTVTEPITPVFPAELVQARLGFVEPLLTAGAFSAAIGRLVASVCAELEKAGQGARRLDLLFERVDGSIQVIRIGTARPSRDGRHLARMLDERLERVDPGLGVEAMRLVVPVADRLAYAQAAVRLAENDGAETDIAPLVDRLANRLGAGQIYRAAPVESEPPRVCRRLFGLN